MKNWTHLVAGVCLASVMAAPPVRSQTTDSGQNQAERLEWFRDLGFGLFIHWSLDSQLGTVISHSLAGASEDYSQRFFSELPRSFNPRKFDPKDWAALAKLAGFKYVVFTAKHHSGFCMWDTATTPFNVMNTPFRRDVTAEVLKAFRDQGIAPGLYFSPDDFWWLHEHGKTIQRHVPDVQPQHNPGLLAYDQAQVRELLSRYGSIDVVFFDGEAQGLRELAWDLQPRIVVTRGAMETPEQHVPGVPIDGPWEACITMGTAWQYQPQNEIYKTGGQLISLLIETRAKGGNLLLNVGPKPDGELPIEQEERLRELALWMFVNQEAIYTVRPWVITNEGDYWFTKRAHEDTLYVFVKGKDRWKRGEWKDIVLKSVEATEKTRVSVLGQNDRVLEYRPDVTPITSFKQESDGLHVRAMHAQRLQDNSAWPNPVVLKITNVKPAFTPPRVQTLRFRWNPATRTATLEGALTEMGKATALDAGFEYRIITGLDANEGSGAWQRVGQTRRSAPGEFSAEVHDWRPGQTYEFRAFVQHPLLTLYGSDQRAAIP